jgi:hypothetical protein
MWVYAVMFFAFAIAVLALGGRIPWSRALWIIPALSFGVALAAPLLFLQLAEAEGRHFGSAGPGANLLGMLIPLGPFAPDIRQPFSQPQFSGQIPYFGTTFAAAGFIGIAYYFYLLGLCKQTWSQARALVGDAAWLLLMLFAAVLALGPDGVLWPLMAHVPPFKDFRWPSKLLPFLAFFAAVGGGMELERWCSPWLRKHSGRLAAATMGLVLLNTYWSRGSLFTFADRPYPRLNASYAALIAPEKPADMGRILTNPEWDSRSPVKDFFRMQSLNFPTVTGALSVGGYDTFVGATPANLSMEKRWSADPVGAARAYGVRWLIWDELFARPILSPNINVAAYELLPRMRERRLLLAVRSQAVPALALEGTEIYRLNETDPLAFVEAPGRERLDLDFDMRGATVNTTGLSPGASVVVNVLWRPWMKAFADGRPVGCHADAWGRVLVRLAETAQVLEVLYRPPWLASTMAGVGIAILGGVAARLLQKRQA